MSKIPFLAIGNDELKDNEDITEFAKCPNCGEQHKVTYGKPFNQHSIRKSKSWAYVECKNGFYLIGINGKRLK